MLCGESAQDEGEPSGAGGGFALGGGAGEEQVEVLDGDVRLDGSVGLAGSNEFGQGAGGAFFACLVGRLGAEGLGGGLDGVVGRGGSMT